MATKKPYYKLDTKKKTITIDDEVKPSDRELQDVATYVSAGYIIKHKSEARSLKAKERARKNKYKNEEILEALKDDAKAKETYEEIKNGKGKGTGFFAAKSWYVDYKNKKEKEAEEAEKETKETKDK